jgi:3-oxoacyl-[acyl-carrier-protein] synthase-1
MTSPDPSGVGASCAMKQALTRAELNPTDIDYVNLHGTGTKFNDSMEAKAVDSVFGNYKVPVSTTKPMTGHTLGAAGALEAAICYFSIVNNQSKNKDEIKLPVQVWDGVQDSELPVLNFVGKDNKWENTGKVKICMSNSFAFGGANSCLIIGVK